MVEAIKGEGVVCNGHEEVYEHIKKLLKSKARAPHVAFSFSLKENGEHVLAIFRSTAQKIGLPAKTILISHENPWLVYASLALLLINAGI